MQSHSYDTIIIGGGFSAIPLARELERSGKSFVFISKKEPIWQQLENENRLDFDLVSSLYTSVYSFELSSLLKKNELKDGYPTAKSFYALHKKYHEQYTNKCILGEVYEICHTQSFYKLILTDGRSYQANHVVLATSFKRKIHHTLKQFDFNANLKDKNIVVTSVGDSSNLLISKLISHGAKVNLVSNGFFALDKYVYVPDIRYHQPHNTFTLDQLEYHTIAKYSPTLYQHTVTGGYQQSYLYPTLTKMLFNPCLALSHPLSKRKDFYQHDNFFKSIINRYYHRKLPVLNGNIAIKYWPIDMYAEKFGQNIERAITAGYLLNDLPFFIDQNLVTLWPKDTTIIDKNKKQIGLGTKRLQYDYLIEGDREAPNLPLIYQDKQKYNPFKYVYRSLFMGIVSPQLPNLYFLGYTRPITGGLCNIIEMQSLLIHQMIVNQKFKCSIYQNIDEKIAKYNQTHYKNKKQTPSDHLVYYGFYTDEIAAYLDIQQCLKEVRSLSDLMKYLFFPRNAFFYRQKGLYKIDNTKQVVDKIFKDHGYFIFNLLYLARYLLLEITAITTIISFPIPLFITLPLAFIHYHLPFTAFLNGKIALPSLKAKPKLKRLLCLIYLPLLTWPLLMLFIKAWWIPGTVLAYSYAISHRLSKTGFFRQVFCDMRSKRESKYSAFFKSYKQVFSLIWKGKSVKLNTGIETIKNKTSSNLII